MTLNQLRIYKTYYDPYSVGIFYKFSTKPFMWTTYEFNEDDLDLHDYVLATLFDNELSKYDKKLFKKLYA